MQRREFLTLAATSPLATTQSVSAATEPDEEDLSKDYFSALPASRTERRTAVKDCANQICETTHLISQNELDQLAQTGEGADEVLQTAQFTVKILNDYNITTAVTEADIETARWDVSDYTRYVPLVQSYINLRETACAVHIEKPETVRDFLFATLAFGLEVALWTTGAPYKLAWRGTRYIANRTFLRFAHHSCSGCIAFAMSELHWAIRGTVYGVVDDDQVEFVWKQIQAMNQTAATLDERGGQYQVELDRSDVVALLDESDKEGISAGPMPREKDDGILDGFLPEVPSLDNLFDFPSFEGLF